MTRGRLRSLALPTLLGLGAFTGGCATGVPFTADARAIELESVPFFPQTDYQCGPAALATVLAHSGLAVTADDLVPDVYVEGLRGSLQAELLGATRRHGLIPYLVEPTPAALLAELAAGRPVLVLQNLGLRNAPVWHYAVVVGVDPERDRVILRSGEEQRRIERGRRFMRSWSLAGQWALVTLPPGQMPAGNDAQRYARALADAEALLPPARAMTAWAAAIAHWPDDALVAFAAANQHFAHERFEQAATLYRATIDRDPGHAAAHNNLAHALAAQGCHAAALASAHSALSLTEAGSSMHQAISDTVERMQSRAGEPPADVCR
jgi:hypothetical protein